MSNLEHLGIGSDGELIKKSRRGCFFYGCLIPIILLVLAVIGAGYFGYRQLDSAIEGILPYTETEELELDRIEYSPEKYGAVMSRINEFDSRAKAGESARLELMENDINMLITSNKDLQELDKYIRVQIKDGQLNGKVSLPLDKLPVGRFAGRYLNGWASFSIAKESGKALGIYITDFRAGSQKPDLKVLEQLKDINLVSQVGDEQKEKLDEKIKKIDRVYLAGNKLIFESN